MVMRYPKTQIVLGKTLKVEVREDLIEKKGAVGLYHYDIPLIAIQKSLPPNIGKVTYMHECYHAIFDRLGLNALISRELEEIIVDAIAVFNEENTDMLIKLLSQKK
jgi:Zn-dependent peptidase ImmA (M78 family)